MPGDERRWNSILKTMYAIFGACPDFYHSTRRQGGLDFRCIKFVHEGRTLREPEAFRMD